jgi:hypothetical protein
VEVKLWVIASAADRGSRDNTIIFFLERSLNLEINRSRFWTSAGSPEKGLYRALSRRLKVASEPASALKKTRTSQISQPVAEQELPSGEPAKLAE